MKKRGIINSTTEVIAPMPEETLESYFKGLETITNVMGVNKITPYTFMVLKGTYLSSKVCKKKYQMETKFRLLPRQFGEYDGEKFFEIEEVCVATSTLSFKDYLEIRGFSFVSSFLINNQFDIIRLHLKELRISNYDYFYEFWQTIKSDHSSLSVLYNQFIEETKNELWDSPEAIYNYFSQEENYHKLLSGELGDNLIRKYEMKLFCFECVSAFELAYEVLLKMAQGKISYDDFNQIRLSLLAAKKWVINVRDVNNIFEVKNRFTIEKTLSLSYDVAKWYTDGFDSEPLVSYKKAITYKIFYNRSNRRRIRSIFQETEKLFGGDFFFQICRILTYRDISDFWRSCIVKEIDRLITK